MKKIICISTNQHFIERFTAITKSLDILLLCRSSIEKVDDFEQTAVF